MPASISDLPEEIVKTIAESNPLLYHANKHLFHIGLPVTFKSLYGTKQCVADSDDEQFAEHLRFLFFLRDIKGTPKAEAVHYIAVNLEAPEIPKGLFPPHRETCRYLDGLVNLEVLTVALEDFGGLQRIPYFEKLKSLRVHIRVPTGATTPLIAEWIYLKFPSLEHIRVYRNVTVDGNDGYFWDLYEEGLVECMARLNWQRKLKSIVFVTFNQFYSSCTWDGCGSYDDWSFTSFSEDGSYTRAANPRWVMAFTRPAEKARLFNSHGFEAFTRQPEKARLFNSDGVELDIDKEIERITGHENAR